MCARNLPLSGTNPTWGMRMLHINRLWCKGCGICIAFCPKKALSLDAEGKAVHEPDKCVSCGLCEQYCPDLAIVLEGKPRKGKKEAAA